MTKTNIFQSLFLFFGILNTGFSAGKIPKKALLLLCSLFLFLSCSEVPANSETSFSLDASINESTTSLNRLKEAVEKSEENVFKGSDLPSYKVNTSVDLSRVKISGEVFNTLLKSAKTFIASGVEICYMIIKPILKDLFPDMIIPEIVNHLLSILIFTLFLSMFVNIPKMVVFILVIFLTVLK